MDSGKYSLLRQMTSQGRVHQSIPAGGGSTALLSKTVLGGTAWRLYRVQQMVYALHSICYILAYLLFMCCIAFCVHSQNITDAT